MTNSLRWRHRSAAPARVQAGVSAKAIRMPAATSLVSGDQLENHMEGHWMARLRIRRSWLVAAIVPIAVFSGACNGDHAAAPAKVIFDKGTPLADLLVPKLTASVTDGAVG